MQQTTCHGVLRNMEELVHTLASTSIVLKSHQAGKVTAAIQKVTSGSGKSHQGRRITMAQPVSSIIGDLLQSSRSIAHSDDFEGHKLIQTNSRQLIHWI